MRTSTVFAVSTCLALAAGACTTGDDGDDHTVVDDDGNLVSGPAVLGLHDGAINKCDNFESWYDNRRKLIFTDAGYPNYPATGEELLAHDWWHPLAVSTVRVSVPWDIALPWSADAGVVTANDPAGEWAQNHLAALKNEQTCLDWWMAAALASHQTVDIAFKPDYDYRDPSTNHILAPSIDAYHKAVEAFTDNYVDCKSGGGGEACVPASHVGGGPGPARVARVHIITPWGEPDYASGQYPKDSTDQTPGCDAGCQGNELGAISRAKEVFFLPSGSSPMDRKRARFDDPNCAAFTDAECGPVLAAQMWMAVAAACPSCKLANGPTANKAASGVVAGDFSGGGGQLPGSTPSGSQSYLKTYVQHLNSTAGGTLTAPPTWALHPYPDASNEEWCRQNTGHDFDPSRGGSVTERVLDSLYELGFRNDTRIWFDEVSVFATDNYVHSSDTPPTATDGASCKTNRSTAKPVYAPSVEATAAKWLVGTLPRTQGSKDPGHEPTIDRVYYFRSFGGSDPDGDNITPTTPTPNQKALYDALVGR